MNTQKMTENDIRSAIIKLEKQGNRGELIPADARRLIALRENLRIIQQARQSSAPVW